MAEQEPTTQSQNEPTAMPANGRDYAAQARQTADRVATAASEYGHDATRHFVREPATDLIALAKAYARDKPDVAACWAFAFGIVVGWKLKP